MYLAKSKEYHEVTAQYYRWDQQVAKQRCKWLKRSEEFVLFIFRIFFQPLALLSVAGRAKQNTNYQEDHFSSFLLLFD